MFLRVRALWRRLSQLLHCSDGSVSVALVAESASLVLQDDILLPPCPVAIVELLLCLHVDKNVHTPSHAPTWLGEGTLGVDELVEDHVVGLITCEGTGDVIGVLAPLRAELRRLDCMVIKLSSSVCCSECIRKEDWKKTVKDRSK